jgi:hypothetical protein
MSTVGIRDAGEILSLATPEQLIFFLDQELWREGSYDPEQGVEWLSLLLESGNETIGRLVPQLDTELLLLIVMHEVVVAGGLSGLENDEARNAPWDHSFDNLFFITFRSAAHGPVIGRFLSVLHRQHHELYLWLMESGRHEILSEVEEEAFAFRNGRLSDAGFPSLEDARLIYSFIDPLSFVVAEGKLPISATVQTLPVILGSDTFLQRVLQRVTTPEIEQELSCLINCALVADQVPLNNRTGIETVSQQVAGYLTIALQHLAGSDEEYAGRIVTGEYLQRLFQLGHSMLIRLRDQSRSLAGQGATLDHLAEQVVAGLAADRPRYHLTLDGVGKDDFRPFADLDDVQRAKNFLSQLSS